MDRRDIGIIAVVGIGAGMIILFLLAGITVAIGHSVPTEYWAAAGSLSGAMVGLLAPQPATKGALARQVSRLNAAIPTDGAAPPGGGGGGPVTEPKVPAAVGAEAPAVGSRTAAGGQAATATATAKQVDITDAPYQPAPGQVAAYAATTARIRAVNETANTAPLYDLRIIGLILVGVAAFGVGIWLALTVGNHLPATASDTAVGNAATALIALGSAAGGALVGLLAPTPGKSNPA